MAARRKHPGCARRLPKRPRPHARTELFPKSSTTPLTSAVRPHNLPSSTTVADVGAVEGTRGVGIGLINRDLRTIRGSLFLSLRWPRARNARHSR
jgi:hypothetical protein